MPARRTTLEMRVLQRARELRVPMPELFVFLKGDEMPPKWVFLKAIDILLEHEDQAGLHEIAGMPANQTRAANDDREGDVAIREGNYGR